MLLAEDHPELHHYTGRAGLEGIFKSSSLWATYFGDLNDSSEIRGFKEPLTIALGRHFAPMISELRADVIHRRVINANGGNRRFGLHLARNWVHSLYTTTFEQSLDAANGICCIASFCSHANDQKYEKHNGLLSQWRGYGEDGGYCLVFDTALLMNLIGQERNSHFYLHLNIQPARYAFDNVQIEKLFPELVEVSSDIVKGAVRGEEIRSLASSSFAPFVTGATAYKHQGFHEEREVRLVAMIATESADARIRHLPGYKPEPLKKLFSINRAGRERRHIALFENNPRLPISRIIVGPSQHQKSNMEFARDLVKGSILVQQSATPYVG